MNFPCFIKSLCPESDLPLRGFSAERVDSEIFVGMAFNGELPPLDYTWDDLHGYCFVESKKDQPDATFNAQICARSKTYDQWKTQFSRKPIVFSSGPQNCTTQCPDGLPFTYQLSAGLVPALTQQDADAAAQSIACQLSAQNIVCEGSITASACLGAFYLSTLATTGAGPFSFNIVAGSLPPGVTLNPQSSQAVFSGTPTQLGSFTFTIRIMNPLGNFMQKTFTITVVNC